MTDHIDTAQERKNLAALAGFTPGPWMRVGWKPCGIYQAGDVSTAMRIASMDERHEHDDDARLIAAAPDLLALANRLLDALDAERAAHGQGQRDYCDLMACHDAHFVAWQTAKARAEKAEESAENDRNMKYSAYAAGYYDCWAGLPNKKDAEAALQRVVDATWNEAMNEAAEAAYEADSLELALHGATKITERIDALKRPEASHE